MGLYSGHNLRTEIWTGFGILLFLLEPSGIININMQIILQNDNIQVISKVFKMPNIVIKVICRVYAKFGILTWNKHKTIQRYENDGVGLFKDAWGQRKSNLILFVLTHTYMINPDQKRPHPLCGHHCKLWNGFAGFLRQPSEFLED